MRILPWLHSGSLARGRQGADGAPKPLWRAWYGELAALGLVCVVGLFLRWYRLSSVPSGVLYDEAHNGLDVLRIIDGARPVFLPANDGREALFIYLQALSVSWFGPTDWPLRVPAAVVGSLTIPVSYLLIAQIYNRRVALLTSAWLAVSLWHTMYSRIGLRTISLPLFGAVGFYCLWLGSDAVWTTEARSPRPRRAARPTAGLGWFAVAGVALGLSQYTYTTARFLPLVVLAFAGYLALAHRRRFWRALPGFILAGVVSVLIFVPEGVYFLRYPEEFASRANAVSIFNSSLNHGDLIGTLFYTASRSLGMFLVEGDHEWQRNIPNRPIFDPVSSSFLVLGLLLTIRSLRNPRAAFTLLWLTIMVVPSVISVLEVPNFLRVTGMIPALFALPALGVDWIWSQWERRVGPRLASVPVLVVGVGFLLGSYQTYVSYFDLWANASGVVQEFNADHWLAVQTARSLATAAKTTYVGDDDADRPVMAYNLRGPGGTSGLLVFNASYSLILPPTGTAANYLFSQRDRPSTAVLSRFFPNQTGQTLARAADGEPIVLYHLPANRFDVRPERTVVAQFDSVLQIIGFDFPRDVQAGGIVTVRWYWKTIGPTPRELAFFNQLYDLGEVRRGQTDDRAFAPDYWPPGTTGISTFDVKVDPTTPTGPATLLVGIYTRDDLGRLSVIDNLGRVAGGQLTLGPIKVHGQPSPAPMIANRQSARFADGIELVGYDLGPNPGKAGQPVTLTLDWASRARPTVDYTVFVHLVDQSGRLVGQADGPPVGGKYPTSIWDPGEIFGDSHVIPLDSQLPAGVYRFEIGLYQPATGQRLPILDPNGAPAGDQVVVGNLEVR